jgi:predicted MFS family arabinose efflux permease
MGMGLLLDLYQENWRWIFSAAAMLGLLSTTLLTSSRLCFKPLIPPPLVEKGPHPSFTEGLRKPWKQVWELIKHHKSFTIYQIGFMLGGAGLMIMQPALPQFFVDNLHLSFTAMGAAISLCKGIGVALTSTAWTRLYRSLTIYQLSSLVTFFASLFPCILISTSFHISLLYIAYILYGVMQAGSELSWHMSSLAFAQEKDTSTFSITNVLTVGIRGCCVPALGSLLLPILRPWGVLCLGSLLCLSASLFFLLKSRYAPSSRLSSPSTG